MTDNAATAPKVGWVFYDGQCPLCVNGVARWGGLFARRGFEWVPLQTPGCAARLEISDADLFTEMKLRLPGGRVFGGIDSWAVLLRSVWWLWPLGALLALPGIHWLGRLGYRTLARNRRCVHGHCQRHGQEANCVHSHRHSAFLELP